MKKKHPILLPALLCLLAFAACERTQKGGGDNTDSLAVATDTVAIRDAGQECANLQPGQFCATGLDILKLGDTLTFNNNIRPSTPDGILKDTVITEANADGDSVSWFAKILRFPDGDIVLDADFNSGEFLGRIRIESGRYHDRNGLRVGSTGRELKAFTQSAYVVPLTEHGVMEVIVPYQASRVIYHFPLADFGKDGKAEYKVSDIPDGSKVVRVVIM